MALSRLQPTPTHGWNSIPGSTLILGTITFPGRSRQTVSPSREGPRRPLPEGGRTGDWVHELLNLAEGPTSVMGQSSVWVAFEFSSDAVFQYEGAYVDNVRISGATCTPPPAPVLNAPSSVASGALINVTWSETSPLSMYVAQEATDLSFLGASSFPVIGPGRSISHTVATPTAYYYRVASGYACGGQLLQSAWSATAQTTVEPPCTFGLSAPGTSIPAAGGNGGVTVTTNVASCAWTAVSNAAWITVTGGASGVGGSAVSFAVAANGGSERTGTLTIAGHTFAVTQAAAGCSYSLSATGASMGLGAASGDFTVTATPATCTWSATSDQPSWLSVVGGATGMGTGSVRYLSIDDPGQIRTGAITAAGLPFTVTQAGVPCALSLSSSSAQVAAAGGTTTVAVTANFSNCQWDATSNDPAWLSIAGANPRTGSGFVTLTAAANTGAVQDRYRDDRGDGVHGDAGSAVRVYAQRVRRHHSGGWWHPPHRHRRE